MKFVYFILMVVFFSGCVPNFYNQFYKPTYDDNSTKSRRAYCGGQAGPPTGIIFDLPENIKATVKTWKNSNGENTYNISFNIPDNVTTEFLTDKIIVKQTEGVKLKAPTTMRLFAHKNIKANTAYKFESLCPISKETVDKLDKPMPINIELSVVTFYQTPPKNLTIHLPEILVNSKTEYAIPPIVLKMYSDKYYLTDELQEIRLKEYSNCKQQTPELTCDNILVNYNKSFIETGDTYTLSGRLFWRSWNNQLMLLLKTQVNTYEQWKFTTKTIILEDTVNHSQILVEPKFINIFCKHDSLPLKTKIYNRANSSVTLDIEGALDTSLSSNIEILLPSMRIGNSIYHFKSIFLNFQFFDAGIDPFNC